MTEPQGTSGTIPMQDDPMTDPTRLATPDPAPSHEEETK